MKINDWRILFYDLLFNIKDIYIKMKKVVGVFFDF